MSISINLTQEEIIEGNIKELQQLYQIKYYPKEGEMIDKIALYLYLKKRQENAIAYAKRSVYFASIPQLRHLIIDLVKSYFYWLDNRIVPELPRDMTISKYRMVMLDGFIEQLREELKEEWSKS